MIDRLPGIAETRSYVPIYVPINGNGHKPNPHPDNPLLMRMLDSYSMVTAYTALAGHLNVDTFYRHTPEPTTEQIEGLKKSTDAAASNTMATWLQEIPFITEKVGSEGDKEVQYAGESAASVKGWYGLGRSNYPVIQGISDVVEGTSALSKRRDGASSLIAISPQPEDGSKGVRPTIGNKDYIVKYAGPPKTRGVIDINLPPRANLANMADAIGVHPQELTVVMLDPSKPGREANLPFFEAAKSLGIDPVVLEAGDFTPGLRAIMGPQHLKDWYPLVEVGRSGAEESSAVAVGAHILGGEWVGKEYDKALGKTDPNHWQENPPLYLADMVPGDPEMTAVINTIITRDPRWFKLPSIGKDSIGYNLTTLVVSRVGPFIRQQRISHAGGYYHLRTLPLPTHVEIAV